jgi:hypothetical protein
MVNEGHRHGMTPERVAHPCYRRRMSRVRIKLIIEYELSYRILCRIAAMLSYQMDRSTLVLLVIWKTRRLFFNSILPSARK